MALLREAHPNADLCIVCDYNTDMGTGRRNWTMPEIMDLTIALDACDTFCAMTPGRILDGLLTYPI
jgi:hypothetical protein